MDEIIDPILGVTPEKSSKPQEVKPPKVSRITPYRQTTGYPVGTDLFGKSNLDRVNEKYGGVNVFTQDFERLRAAEQPWTHQAIGFVNQAIGEIVGGTIEGVGYLGEIPNVIKGVYDSEQEFGNALSRYGASIKESTRESTPIYTTGSGWDPGDSGWWFSNGVSIASTLSLMIPARGVSAGLGLLGKGASRLGKAGKALNGVLQIGGKSGQIIRQGVTQAVTSRHMENMMEAAGTYEDEYQKLIDKGFDEKDAREYASEAASTNYRWGWVMLTQDILQYTLMAKFKNPYNPTNPNRVEEVIYRTVGKAGKVGRYLNKNRGIGSLAIGFISEGAEEAYQYGLAEEAKYLADVSAGIANESNFSERFGDYTKDGEMWTSAFFGGFGGMVFQATGAYAENKINKEWLEKRENWLKLRGSALGKMQGDIQKAREAGDINSEINALKLNNLTTTVEALEHDQFDFHLSQYEEFVAMSSEDLQQYNEANPGAELTQEFVNEIAPMLAKDAKRIKEIHDTLVKKELSVNTLGAVTSRQFLGEVYSEKQKLAETNKSQALDKTLKAFPIQNRNTLDLALQVQALTAAIENISVVEQDTVNTDTIEWAQKKRSELEKKLAEANKAIDEIEDKSDIENINAILADNTVAVPNATASIFEMYKEKELQEASRMQTKEYQNNQLYEATTSLINATKTEAQLDNLATSFNTLKLTQEQIEKLKSLAEQKRKLLQNSKTQEEVKREENARVASITTENDVENAGDFDFASMGIEVPASVVTPETTTETTPVSTETQRTIPVGTTVTIKGGQLAGKTGVITDAPLDANGRTAVSVDNIIRRYAEKSLTPVEATPVASDTKVTEQIKSDEKTEVDKSKVETSIPSEAAVAQKVEQKKSVDKVFNLISNYFDKTGNIYKNLQGWKTWLDSGANPETAKVELLEATSFYKEGERLKTLFDKLKNNEELSKEDKIFLIDNYPLEVRVLDNEGSPLIMDGNEVRNYLYEMRPDSNVYQKDPGKLSVDRQIRGELILQLAKGNVSITLKGQHGGLSTVLDKPSITEEHNIESLNEFRLTGTPSDFLMVNQDGNYSDTGGNLDLDTAKYPKPSKEDGNPMAGNIFVKVKSPTGVIIPVKLNKKKIDNTEAEFIYRLFADLLALDKHGFKKPIPENLKNQLDVLVPEEGIFSQNPTYGEVINFFINYKGSEVDLTNPLPHDFALINKELKFNFNRVTDKNGNPQISVSTLTLGIVQNQGVASNAAKVQEFINFLQGLRRQIDTKRLVNDKAYSEHITGNKILNTDFAQGKVFKPNSGQLQVEIIKSNSNVTTSKAAVAPSITPVAAKVDAVDNKSKPKITIANVSDTVANKIMDEAIKNKDVVTNTETKVDDTKVVIAQQSESMKLLTDNIKNIMKQRKNKDC